MCTLKVYILCFESILLYFENILLHFESIVLHIQSILLYFESILVYFEGLLRKYILYFDSILLYFESICSWKHIYVDKQILDLHATEFQRSQVQQWQYLSPCWVCTCRRTNFIPARNQTWQISRAVVCLLMALLLLNTVTAEAQPHAQPSAARPAHPVAQHGQTPRLFFLN